MRCSAPLLWSRQGSPRSFHHCCISVGGRRERGAWPMQTHGLRDGERMATIMTRGEACVT
eukprot:7084335-Pyramimonas_sp.AAC.1